MFNPDREELAWAAGWFDGEGCIGLYSQGPRNSTIQRLSLSIAQAESRFNLDRFKQAVGGVGVVGGPYHRGHKPVYRYNAVGFRSVQAVGAMLWFKLGAPKRLQVSKSLSAAIRYHRRQQKQRPTSNNAKLTVSDVREIRRLYVVNHTSSSEIARKFGVTRGTIWRVARSCPLSEEGG